MKKSVADLKAGDKMKVVHVLQPWALSLGDVITLIDPPVVKVASSWVQSFTKEEYVLRFGNDRFIPYEFVESIEDDPKICKCNIMATGCVCGVFQKEQLR